MSNHNDMQQATSLNPNQIRPQNEGVQGSYRIRVITYNIHSCVDRKRRVNLKKIADIIGHLKVDIVCLQEVDRQQRTHMARNQAQLLANHLRMNHHFFPVEKAGLHAFGLAILSRFPLTDGRHSFLPSLYPFLNPRKRGVMRVSIQTPAGLIHVINTHLSLFKLERRKQLKVLLGKDWFSAIPKDAPLIFCGDLNAGPLSRTYRTLSRLLTDVQKDRHNPRRFRAQPTFHSKSPMFRIDHIFVSRHFQTIHLEVQNTPDTQMASDHLPLIADLAV
jgi:endonuclease/exonuclease/phosphatase family metal-dependent hydrolase